MTDSQSNRTVESPCNGVCRLQAEVCVGCGRTSDEIACWSLAGAAVREQIVRDAAARLRKLAASRSVPEQGFTLVELLVAMSITAILVALLLPAVQTVREAARKVSCQNNLHQIGIGLHSYHNVHASLPTGCVEWRGWNHPPTHRQFAWSAMLLPFVEQQPLYNQIDWSVPYDAAENEAAADTTVPTYLCPSEPAAGQQPGHISFGGLYGERIVDSQPDDGLFLYDIAIRFRDIRDGLTYTLAVAEDTGGPDTQWINGRNVFVVAHGINDASAWIGDNEIRSAHDDGAMVLFADGRVTFMNESIDKQLLGQLITRDNGEQARYP